MKRAVPKILLGFLLFLDCVRTNAAPPKTKADVGPAPVQLLRGPQNHLLIPAVANGHPAVFLLDTGEEINFVQSNHAQALSVRRLDRQIRSGGRWFDRGEMASLRIGSTMLPPVDVALYDAAQFRGPVPGPRGKAADGIIGFELLRRSRAIINCRTQQLFLQDESARAVDLDRATRELGFKRIPITQENNGALTVPCSIGEKNSRIALDTGAFVTLFDAAAVRDLQLEKQASGLSARTPAGNIHELALAEFHGLTIGGVAIAPQKFAVMDIFAEQKPLRTFLGINHLLFYDARTFHEKVEILGLLGNELLYQHYAIIDLNRMFLFLK